MENEKILTLKERISKEMTVDYANILEKNFDLAKEFVKITKEGKVDVVVKDRLIGKERILIYLIGKLYAKEGGLSQSEFVSNKELSNELGIGMNSVLPWLKVLRDHKQIKALKSGIHAIELSKVEEILKQVEKKIKSG
jgi:hypothetical protein